MSGFQIDGSYKLLPIYENDISIVFDPEKGRCLIAQRDFNPGEIIIKERAFVHASYKSKAFDFPSDELKLNFVNIYKETNPKVLRELPSLIKSLCKLSKIQSRDTARCLLQLIAINNDSHNNSSSIDINRDFNLNMFSQLSAANVSQCRKDISKFRKSHPKWLPKSLNDNHIANLLGILNTNQMELEEFGGSGLFLVAAIIEHSCLPNSSYTTDKDVVYVNAITQIKAGDRISIDYAGNYYNPIAERIQSLKSSYGFICKCSACIGPETKRSFWCVKCKSGVVCPSKYCEISGDNVPWICLSCNNVLSDEAKLDLIKFENLFLDTEFESLESINLLRDQRIMHPSHYAIYWAILGLSMQYSDIGHSEVKNALIGYREVIALLDIYLPGYHHEKVLHLDKLGQLALLSGDFELSKDYFIKAYNMSIHACGNEALITRNLRVLIETPPRSIEELRIHYQAEDLDSDSDMDET